jgi:hypothetical protein
MFVKIGDTWYNVGHISAIKPYPDRPYGLAYVVTFSHEQAKGITEEEFRRLMSVSRLQTDKPGFDRKAYQREYMRGCRARRKGTP